MACAIFDHASGMRRTLRIVHIRRIRPRLSAGAAAAEYPSSQSGLSENRAEYRMRDSRHDLSE
jgi:hypothetical protein